MRRHCLFNFLIFYLNVFCVNLFGQYDGQIKGFNPATPQAHSFTKYGSIPVNESAGLANINLPIGDYTLGSITVPISLSYVTEGVKVDEMNGWVGMSWNLNAGGLITRTVNDQQDESKQGSSLRALYSEETLNVFKQDHPYFSKELWDMTEPNFDSEVDIFNFNFCGHSGSFFLDQFYIPRQIKGEEELKINYTYSQNVLTIIITTKDGIRYHFGGQGASETTSIKYGDSGSFERPSPTALHLYMIENNTGDKVFFEYTEAPSFYKTIGYSQTFEKRIGVAANSETAYPGSGAGCGMGVDYQYLMPKEVCQITQLVNGEKTLSRIYSNRSDNVVEFVSTINTHPEVQRKILTEVKFSRTNLPIYKRISLEYSSGFSTSRQFLSQLKIFGKGETVTNNTYSFLYDDISGMPLRFSYAQDHFGFYNGKLSNQNFIPRVHDTQLYIPFDFADRDASFQFAKKGILTRITYPTKGYTEFLYECGKESWPQDFEKRSKIMTLSYNTPANNGIIQLQNIQNPNVGGTLLNTARPVDVKINATIKGPLSSANKLKITLDDINSSNDFTEFIELENIITNPNVQVKYVNKVITFSNLSPTATYVFKIDYIKTDPLATYPTGSNYVIVNSEFDYYTTTPLVKDKLGIRVRKVTDYSATGEVADIKRYYYNKFENISNLFDSQPFVYTPSYASTKVVEMPCFSSPAAPSLYDCETLLIVSKIISSNSTNSIYLPYSGKYQFVTISYGGENFENGGIQKTFIQHPDGDVQTFISPLSNSIYKYPTFSKTTNSGLTNGTLLQEKTYKKVSGDIVTSRQVDYEYTILPQKSGFVTNCLVNKLFLRNSCARFMYDQTNGVLIELGPIDYYTEYSLDGSLPYVTRSAFFGTYYTYFKAFCMSKVTTTDFFGSESVQSIVENLYDSELIGLPTRQIISGSSGNHTTKFYYPQDLISEPFMSELVQVNQLDPVRIEKFYNDSKISESKTIYERNLSTSNLLLRKYIYNAKFPNALPDIPGIGTLEKDVVYDLYDNRGNLLQYTAQNATPVSLVWGYDGSQVIAKLENCVYSSLPQNMISDLQNLSRNDNDSCFSGNCNEMNLRNSLLNLHSLYSSSLVTTYTYDPLIGLTSVTDSRGFTTTYQYDANGRLISARDHQGNLLSENQYHYKN